MKGYFVNTRRVLWFALFIGLCISLAFEASCSISVRDGLLRVKYNRCWTLINAERSISVDDIENITVTQDCPGKGSGGPRWVVVIGRHDEIKFGCTMDGWGDKLGNKAYSVKDSLIQCIRSNLELDPIVVFPLKIWLGVAVVLLIFCPLVSMRKITTVS